MKLHEGEKILCLRETEVDILSKGQPQHRNSGPEHLRSDENKSYIFAFLYLPPLHSVVVITFASPCGRSLVSNQTETDWAFLRGSAVKNQPVRRHIRSHSLNPWVRKIFWRRK